jgi:hypothetical protein
MALLPRPRTPNAQIGHRRAHSSALEICLTNKEEQELQDAQPLLEDKVLIVPTPKSRLPVAVFIVLWTVSIVVACTCTYLWTVARVKASSFGSFASGFATELRMYRLFDLHNGLLLTAIPGDAHSAVHVRKQQFYGSLDFNGHHGFIPLDSPSLKYVGSTPGVDNAWEALSKDRYFLLSDEEAREAYGADPSIYWNVHHGGYIAGLDALHTLHCLNHLRMSIYPDVYPQDPIDGPMHKAHCVDHLRQLIMCNADLTPVPTQYFEGLERNYINSSRVHTCRDFSKIREWATERFNGSTAVKPRNRDGASPCEVYK